MQRLKIKKLLKRKNKRSRYTKAAQKNNFIALANKDALSLTTNFP